jgi:outer membrane protein
MSNAQDQWSLERCISTAIQRNLSIKNIDLTLQGSEIDINQARQSRYPNLNGSVGVNLNFGRTIDPTRNEFLTQSFFSNSFGLNSGVSLYNGNRINNTIKQSLLNYKSAKLSKDQVERDIALNVASIYLNVLFTKENVTIADINYEATKAQLSQMQKLVSSGSRAESELYNIQATLANNEQAKVTANNAYEIAIIQLKQAILIDQEEPFELAEVSDDIEITSDPDLLTVEELYRSALTNQKSIQAAEVNVESSGLGVEIAKSQLLPSVNLFGQLGTNYSNQGRTITGFTESYTDINVIINDMDIPISFPTTEANFSNTPYADQISENLSYGFGMNVSVPIYNNYAPKASIQRAKINRESSLISLEQEKQNLLVTVQGALADSKAAKSTLNASEKSLNAQELNYENAKKRFEIDAIGTFELTNIKSLYDGARLNYLLAKYDYIFRTKVLDFYLGKPIILK